MAIPYLLLVVASVGLQYLQMSRLNARNPQAAQANPQAAMLQKYMPLIFGFIYLNVAAILNVYFIVSSAIRIVTQEMLFRQGIVAGPPARHRRRTGKGKPKARSSTERTALPESKTAATEAPRKPEPEQDRLRQRGRWRRRTARPGQTGRSPTRTNGATAKRTPGRPTANGKKAPAPADRRNGPASPSATGATAAERGASAAAAPRSIPDRRPSGQRKAR